MHGVDRMIRTASGLLMSVCVLFGQTEAPQAFEVASIKSSKLSGEGSRRERIEATPGSLIMANVRFATAMRWAYRVQDVQINGPGWINDERFDIFAKAATPVGGPIQAVAPQTDQGDDGVRGGGRQRGP